MEKEKLKKYLEKRLTNCEKAKLKNISLTHGLGNYNTPSTEAGKITDAFLKGKIEIIKDILNLLED